MKCSYCNAENDGAYKGPCPQCKPRDQLREMLRGGVRLIDNADIIRLVESYPVPSDWIRDARDEHLWEFHNSCLKPDWRWKTEELEKLDIVDLYLLWQELKKEDQDAD